MNNLISSSDIASGGFSSWFASQLSSFTPFNVACVLLSGLVVGIAISLVYKKTYRGVLYSPTFSLTLIMLTLVTAPVVMAIGSNVALSMGMVGALSIVRFRTAIKEPLDIAFLFWSIAAGIVLAAGMIPLAVFGSVIIGVVLLIFANRKASSNPFILVLTCDSHSAEEAAISFLDGKVKKLNVKSKTAQKGLVELNLEVRLNDDNTDFVNELSELEGVQSAVLVSYNGDYMG